uniref:Uncharacterized protein n=1 Tax=Melanopsichium pennsylvanicum 4 TaxID=1398559 RepID=A0A077QS51_9BASI|nr:uncharacterized protein BN887_06060 [Melanopsichium pennsylvanicum 4]
MLWRLELCSDAERAAALSGEEAEGVGPLGEVADGDDLGSQAPSSPWNDDDDPRLPNSLALGLDVFRLAELNGLLSAKSGQADQRDQGEDAIGWYEFEIKRSQSQDVETERMSVVVWVDKCDLLRFEADDAKA